MTTKCPTCGKSVEENGYVFGEELKTMCVECTSCGTRIYLHVPSPADKILIPNPKSRTRHKKRFHCPVCKELIVRIRTEKTELAAYTRHCKTKHPDLPEPNSIVFLYEDLNKKEKECLDYLNNFVRNLDEDKKSQEFQDMLAKHRKEKSRSNQDKCEAEQPEKTEKNKNNSS